MAEEQLLRQEKECVGETTASDEGELGERRLRGDEGKRIRPRAADPLLWGKEEDPAAHYYISDASPRKKVESEKDEKAKV